MRVSPRAHDPVERTPGPARGAEGGGEGPTQNSAVEGRAEGLSLHGVQLLAQGAAPGVGVGQQAEGVLGTQTQREPFSDPGQRTPLWTISNVSRVEHDIWYTDWTKMGRRPWSSAAGRPVPLFTVLRPRTGVCLYSGVCDCAPPYNITLYRCSPGSPQNRGVSVLRCVCLCLRSYL